MKIRNIDARCENCPYWAAVGQNWGACQRERPNGETTVDTDWCGHHPNLLVETPDAEA